jgi:hypothetical protein
LCILLDLPWEMQPQQNRVSAPNPRKTNPQAFGAYGERESCELVKNSHFVYDQTQGFGAVIFLTLRKTLLWHRMEWTCNLTHYCFKCRRSLKSQVMSSTYNI